MKPERNDRLKVTVITPAYNNAEMIGDFLDWLLPQDYPDYEVIVVDDGSTDGTPDVVRKYPVRLIESKHLGISAARNQGIRASQGDIILGIDSDLKVPPDLIKRMVSALEDERIGIAMAWWDISNPENLVSSLIYRGYEYYMRRLNEPDFLWAYCFITRKKIFSEVGFFDESIYVGEDVDLSHRVIEAGYVIKLLKEVKVWHYFRDSLAKHLQRHFKTARHKFLYVHRTKRFTDQRGTMVEYIKLFFHFLTLVSIVVIPWYPSLFLILLLLSLLSHLKMTLWSMKKGSKYILMLPFKFLTKMAWVFGVIQGFFWILRGYNPSPKDL